MRDEQLYIQDMLDSIRAIEGYVTGIAYEEFIADRKTYSATLREFIVIGEAIAKLSDTTKERAAQIDWRAIKDFRNILVHEYFGIDPAIVWVAVVQELPILKAELTKLVQMS